MLTLLASKLAPASSAEPCALTEKLTRSCWNGEHFRPTLALCLLVAQRVACIYGQDLRADWSSACSSQGSPGPTLWTHGLLSPCGKWAHAASFQPTLAFSLTRGNAQSALHKFTCNIKNKVCLIGLTSLTLAWAQWNSPDCADVNVPGAEAQLSVQWGIRSLSQPLKWPSGGCWAPALLLLVCCVFQLAREFVEMSILLMDNVPT